MEPPKLFSLSDVVHSTAEELRRIQASPPAAGEAVMQFSGCEIEVAATVSADASGKVKVWVIEGGIGGAYANSQKVTLKFDSIPGGPGIAAIAADEGPAPLPKPRGAG